MERLLGNSWVGAISLATGVGQTFIQTAMPLLQLLAACMGIILAGITISIKWEERKRLHKR